MARNWMERHVNWGSRWDVDGLEFAALHLRRCLSDARLLLQEVTDSQPQNLQAGHAQCGADSAGRCDRCGAGDLPRMIKTSGTVDNYFVQVTGTSGDA